MSEENEFRENVRKYLAELSSSLEEVIQKLVTHNYPEEVKRLDFEVLTSEFTEMFPVRAFFMDEDNNEYFVYIEGKAEYPSPVDPCLLDIRYVYPEEFEDQYLDNDDIDAWALATEELIEWFSAIWISCGGNKFPREATIAAHDSYFKFNLVASKWQAYE